MFKASNYGREGEEGAEEEEKLVNMCACGCTAERSCETRRRKKSRRLTAAAIATYM